MRRKKLIKGTENKNEEKKQNKTFVLELKLAHWRRYQFVRLAALLVARQKQLARVKVMHNLGARQPAAV